MIDIDALMKIERPVSDKEKEKNQKKEQMMLNAELLQHESEIIKHAVSVTPVMANSLKED